MGALTMFDLIRGGPLEILLSQVASICNKIHTSWRNAPHAKKAKRGVRVLFTDSREG